jgi:hypothetical protein
MRFSGMAPCKDCPDRFVGCHSTCEKYIQYKKEGREEWLKHRDDYIRQREIEEYTIMAKQKSKRRRR